MKRPLALPVLALVALASCATGGDARKWYNLGGIQPPAYPIQDHTIVPGVRVGPVALGMAAAQLIQAMGEPNVSNDWVFQPDSLYVWGHWEAGNNDGYRVMVGAKSQQVYSIMLAEWTDYRTAEGVGPGSSVLAVKSAFGAPEKIFFNEHSLTNYCYFSRGLSFLVTTEGVVDTVHVYHPGGYCQ